MQTEFSGNETQVLYVESKIYILMNKPAGYVCKAVADRNETVFELLPEHLQMLVQDAKRGERLHTIGRLDKDTTGLLLITNDGFLSHKLTAPENCILKKYEVELETQVPPEQQQKYVQIAAKGMVLPPDKKAPEQKSAPAQLTFSDSTHCTITVTEGKFHEVRRIFCVLGNKVVTLKRIQMGFIQLESTLKEGTWRYLTQQELSRLI